MAEPKPKPSIANFKRDPKPSAIEGRGRNPSISQNENNGYKCLTLRVVPDDWLRLSDLVRKDRTSMQRFIVDCIDAELRRRGLPGIVTNDERPPRW